jgi:hypothetical protein
MRQRCTGRLPAVHDPRVMRLEHRMRGATLPLTPNRTYWHALLPDDGIPMLGNDRVGNCVWASAFHYLQQVGLYTRRPLKPTTDECLRAYADGTGWNPSDPSSDNGTVMLGPGGMIEYWSTKGITVGGVLNKCGPVASVNFHNPDELQAAIYLFGYVFVGAALTQADVDTDFLWMNKSGPIVGRHEFIVTGYTRIADQVRYDILTWNEMLRCDGDWLNASVEEALVVYDESFFNARGVSPGSVDKLALMDDMRAFV